jgi:hypothetical protein
MPTPMPTAARLFAALAFAGVGFFGAEVLQPAFPEGTEFGWFSPVMAGIGLLCGWLVMGPNAGRGAVRAAGTGLRTSVTVVFWGMLLFAVREMLLRSTARRYDGVTEAVVGTFEIILEQGRILLSSPEALIVLAAGGVLGGLVSNWAAERFS